MTVISTSLNHNIFEYEDRISVGNSTSIISDLLKGIYTKKKRDEAVRGQLPVERKVNLEEKLYIARAYCKTKTAEVAMHLPADYRIRFFDQIDNLMDYENWNEEDKPITQGSISTFLQMLIHINPLKKPGIGATSTGNLIAAWLKDNNDRLTFECLPNNNIHWILSNYINDEYQIHEGNTPLNQLLLSLLPYNPDKWFKSQYDFKKKRQNT